MKNLTLKIIDDVRLHTDDYPILAHMMSIQVWGQVRPGVLLKVMSRVYWQFGYHIVDRFQDQTFGKLK